MRKLVNLCHIFNSELMKTRYKDIWYKGLAVIPYFLIPYKLKMLILWTDSK